jgi:hypothetical protein
MSLFLAAFKRWHGRCKERRRRTSIFWSRTMSRIVMSILVSAVCMIPAVPASAQQYRVRTPAGEKVVHTRLAPVVMHRIFPPYYGKHVYRRSR